MSRARFAVLFIAVGIAMAASMMKFGAEATFKFTILGAFAVAFVGWTLSRRSKVLVKHEPTFGPITQRVNDARREA